MRAEAPERALTFVNSRPRLDDAVAAIGAAPVVGFDTEFVGEATYEPKLCLIQVSTEDHVLVIDPLAGLDLGGFWQALTARGREVIALAARQELSFCLRYASRLPETTFDPQISAGLLGFGYPLSQLNLVQKVLGIRVAGGEAYTDWRQRPLTGQQLEYAADDVRHLLALREALNRQAASLGRTDWVRGECERLAERVRQSQHEERWLRVSGSSNLNRRQLAVLRELWRWRDRTARAADLPSRRILGDDLMIAIAKRSPRDTADLFALRGMDRSGLRRSGAEISAAVQSGLALPESALPSLMRRDDPPQVSILAQIAAVLANSLAAEHQVDPALLATSADIQELIRWRLGIADAPPTLTSGWRGEIVGRPLIELLDGERLIRVADINSPSPLRIEQSPAGSGRLATHDV